MTITFSHFGICVADLEESRRFYCEALGFEVGASFPVGNEFGRLMELDGVELQSQFLTRDGLSIELLAFASPPTVGEPTRRPVNRLGLTHLSIRVDDVDAVAAKIAELGGTVLDGTRTTMGDRADPRAPDFVYCTDPNGVRIELMRLPA